MSCNGSQSHNSQANDYTMCCPDISSPLAVLMSFITSAEASPQFYIGADLLSVPMVLAILSIFTFFHLDVSTFRKDAIRTIGQ